MLRKISGHFFIQTKVSKHAFLVRLAKYFGDTFSFCVESDAHEQIVQGAASFVAWELRQVAGFVRGLQFGAEALVFGFVEGDVGIFEFGEFGGKFASYEIGEAGKLESFI